MLINNPKDKTLKLINTCPFTESVSMEEQNAEEVVHGICSCHRGGRGFERKGSRTTKCFSTQQNIQGNDGRKVSFLISLAMQDMSTERLSL